MKHQRTSADIPGPKGHWLFGSLKEFRADSLAFYERCHREYGAVSAFRLGPRRLIMVNDPEIIEQALVTQNRAFRKHFATRLLRPVLGNGLLLSEGQAWLEQRRLLQTAFSRSFADDFASIVRQHTAELAKSWRTTPRRDLYRDMTQLTVQVAAHAFLGIQEPTDMESIGDSLETIHADFEARYQNPWHPPYWVPTASNRKLRRAVGRLTSIIDRMIAIRRKEREGADALSLLLRAHEKLGQPLPKQLLRDEVMTLLLAGHDTTANNLTWTWILLARHPHIARKLAEESNRAAAAMQPTSLTHRIVKESMRLFPPVYMTGRETIESAKLGPYTIGKGETVVFSQWVVHRDEEHYENAGVFDPDRWTSEFESSLPRYAFFPFGGGPRVCIGKQVALTEAAMVLAMLAAEFDLELEFPADVTPWPTVTLRPRGAVMAQIHPRHGERSEARNRRRQGSGSNYSLR